jgi:hypothetical protein
LRFSKLTDSNFYYQNDDSNKGTKIHKISNSLLIIEGFKINKP